MNKKIEILVTHWVQFVSDEEGGMWPGGQPPMLSLATEKYTGEYAVAFEWDERSCLKRDKLATERLMKRLGELNDK